jgi:hypothetical protein
MAQGAYSVLVSLIALLLFSPIVGVNQNIVENHSEFLASNYDDGSRDGDYDVSLEFAEGNEGISYVTRNEEIQKEFVVINEGTFNDTYDLSVSWDYFNILFPNTETALILNALSNIQSNGCISKISLSLNFKIKIICNEIRINLKKNKWTKYNKLHISSTFFFERRVFDDLYDKQSNFVVNIDTTSFVINKINLGHHIIEYSFVDKGNMQLMIDGEVVILTKKHEGLNIHTVDSDYFFLNSNYFKNTIKR